MHAYVTDVTTSKKLMQKLHIIMTNNKFVNTTSLIEIVPGPPSPTIQSPQTQKKINKIKLLPPPSQFTSLHICDTMTVI